MSKPDHFRLYPGLAMKIPVYCHGGIRCKDGMTCMQAFRTKRRNLEWSVKGAAQAEAPQEPEYQYPLFRGGPARSSVEVFVMNMERRCRLIHVNVIVQLIKH